MDTAKTSNLESFDIALGYNDGANSTSFSNNIDIGNAGVTGEANKIRIGTVGTQNGTFIAGIFWDKRGQWRRSDDKPRR